MADRGHQSPNPKQALSDYRKWWGIECPFGDTKARGLNFDDTHITNPEAAREVSHFARNSRDWQQLIEMCRVFDTLLVDQETVYPPRQRNDRLLLEHVLFNLGHTRLP